MKYRIYLLALLFSLGLAARADGLNKDHVTSDAKWLVHVDCENLRQTQVGDYLFQRVLTPMLNGALGGLKLNVSNILQQVRSLTAFGPDIKKGPQVNGVLLINCDAETQKALEGLLVAQVLANTNGPIKQLVSEDQSLYSFGNEVFIAPYKNGPIVISKSQEQIDLMRDLLAGKGSSLASSPSFSEFPIVANSFFILGAAELLNQLEGIPAKAKVLQMADGGRIALGERSEQVFLDLALRGKTAEAARQIRQVIEGMVALVNLGQPDFPDVMDLAKSVKVSSADRVVSISMEYPASKAIARLNDAMAPKVQQNKPPRHKAKVKHMQKETDPSEPSPTKPEAEEPKAAE